MAGLLLRFIFLVSFVCLNVSPIVTMLATLSENFIFSGRKAGKGVYIYEKGSKDRPENPEALALLKDFALTMPEG